jgi:methionyl-tRNA formyltransferase
VSGRFAIACRTPWFWDLWSLADLPGEWLEIRTPADLTVETLGAFGPEMVFFPHWSRIVDASIWSRWPCVVMHAAPLPWGRGGSPIQNQIAQGRTETELCALRMTETVDGGPVYARRTVSLLGGGDEVFIRLNKAILDLTRHVVAERPTPVPQTGEPTVFSRRRPRHSAVPHGLDLAQLFDHIRMLDAEGYPKAFLEHAGFRLELSRPALRRGRIEADVCISRVPGNEED